MCNESVRRKGEKRAETILKETMTENFLKLMKILIYISKEVQGTPSTINKEKLTFRNIIAKMNYTL